jgi:hypothetical protein
MKKPSPVPRPRLTNSFKDWCAIVLYAVLFACSLGWSWIEKSFPVRKKKQGKVVQMKNDWRQFVEDHESFYNQD